MTLRLFFYRERNHWNLEKHEFLIKICSTVVSLLSKGKKTVVHGAIWLKMFDKNRLQVTRLVLVFTKRALGEQVLVCDLLSRKRFFEKERLSRIEKCAKCISESGIVAIALFHRDRFAIVQYNYLQAKLIHHFAIIIRALTECLLSSRTRSFRVSSEITENITEFKEYKRI